MPKVVSPIDNDLDSIYSTKALNVAQVVQQVFIPKQEKQVTSGFLNNTCKCLADLLPPV